MSETGSQQPPQEETFSRRELFTRKAPAAALTAVTAGEFLNNEIKKGQEGVVTPSAIFLPLYERHDISINPEDIPRNTDILFREGPAPTAQYIKDINDFLLNMTWVKQKNPQFVDKFSREQLRLMFGDNMFWPYPEGKSLNSSYAHTVGIEDLLGTATLTTLASTLKDAKDNVSRRKILAGVGAVAAWALAPDALDTVTPTLFNTQNAAIKRLIARVSGLAQDLHPELKLTFFRSLVMADKLLTVGEHEYAKTGKKPNIAYWVGYNHSGIEDFLQAGHDVCRTLIEAYPKDFLKPTTNMNGGVHDFSTSLLVTTPANLTYEELERYKKENVPAIPASRFTQVTDTQLEKGLEAKLAK